MKRALLYILLSLATGYVYALPTRQAIADTLNRFAAQRAAVNSITVNRASYSRGVIRITANEHLAALPWRKADLEELENILRRMYANRTASVVIKSGSVNIADLLLPETELQSMAGGYRLPASTPWVTPTDRPYAPNNGLSGKHIALWASHGYHYDNRLDRWEWQRARLLQTVEDLFTSSYTIPYLVPMLENAGAYVVQPRERDIQTHEVVVDNDHPTRNGRYSQHRAWDKQPKGFAQHQQVYVSNENPFHTGTYVQCKATDDSIHSPSITWQPDIPESGEYAVYVSYHTVRNSVEDALYTIRHQGGVSRYKVNQRMGGGTWVYIGTFHFEKGKHENGSVSLSSYSRQSGVVTADAVRFGGGMGNIARSPAIEPEDTLFTCIDDSTAHTSGLPRWMEGARYYLQWSGMPDSIYRFRKPDEPKPADNDYTDDLTCRGKWVNHLAGGSAANPTQEGLGVPVDLVLALHSDAGVTPTDSIVGTLAIYTTRDDDKQETYPTGASRKNVRELADRVQTQIVADIRALYAPEWERRGLADKSYSETRLPKMPALIIELLSHQNYADMRYGHDPQFKFSVSRSIYKGILKYLHSQDGTPYTVQPLPVSSFGITPVDDRHVKLKWKSTPDALEPTAKATGYVVYTQTDNKGFDNGRYTEADSCIVKIEAGKHYSFRITAVNDGGQSLPSETLSAYVHPYAKGTALIINGFDKTSAPEGFCIDSTYAGFYGDHMGIAHGYDLSYVGRQYEFRKDIPWYDDDAPGFGASHADYERTVCAGNTFDYPGKHGKALAAAGYSYVSCSHTSVDSLTSTTYAIVDLILGRQGRSSQDSTAFACYPHHIQRYLSRYADAGGCIIVSGAHVGSDVWLYSDETEQRFVRHLLHYTWRTNHASNGGHVQTVANSIGCFDKQRTEYRYPTEPNPAVYPVTCPDAIEPYGNGACTIMRYADNHLSAATAYKGSRHKTCIFGFPIECLISQTEINDLIMEVIRFFEP